MIACLGVGIAICAEQGPPGTRDDLYLLGAWLVLIGADRGAHSAHDFPAG